MRDVSKQQVRQALGISERTAARKAGVTRATLRKYEAGVLEPSPDRIRCDAFFRRLRMAVGVANALGVVDAPDSVPPSTAA